MAGAAGAALLRSLAVRVRPRADNPRDSAIEDNMFDLSENRMSQSMQRWTIGNSVVSKIAKC